MTTVKVLVDYVGVHMAGDIVTDAPAGLIHMATVGTTNAATGERVAEIVEGTDKESIKMAAKLLKELKANAKALDIPDYEKMDTEELTEALETAIAKREQDEKDAAEALEVARQAEVLVAANVDKTNAAGNAGGEVDGQ